MQPDRKEKDSKQREKALDLSQRRLLWALGLSLFVHFLFAGGLVIRPSEPPAQKVQSVEMVSPEELAQWMEAQRKNQSRQIVDSSKEKLNDLQDPNAKYLSRHNQKVLRETKAAQHGEFKNSAGSGPRESNTSPQPPAPATQVTKGGPSEPQRLQPSATEGDVTVGASSPPRKRLKFSNQAKDVSIFTPDFRKLPELEQNVANANKGDGNEASTTDDHLKEVKTGMQTLLSTREFVYFSYYNRIKEKLRQHWQPKIRERFTRIIRSGRQIASDGTDKVTKVVIILDENGTLVRVQILSQSGLVDLDEAAVDAFRAAAPFPNPPKGIIESDGTVKIRWDFVVEA